MVNGSQRHCHVNLCDSWNHRQRGSQGFRRPEVAHDFVASFIIPLENLRRAFSMGANVHVGHRVYRVYG